MNPLEIVIPVEATGLFQYAWLMIAIPLGVAAILLLGGRATNAWGHWLGVLGVVGSFAVAAALFAQMLGPTSRTAPSRCRCSSGSVSVTCT